MSSNIFKDTREVSWSAIIGVVIASVGTALFNQFILARHEVFFNLHGITNGLIHPVLLYTLISLAIVCFIIFGWARLKPREVGCLRTALKPALMFLFGFWFVAQGCFALLSLFRTGTLEWNITWGQGWPAVVGLFIAYLFGTAIYEELAFRGFMLPQFYLKLGGSPENQTRKHLVYAILASQIVFSLVHIPRLIYDGANLGLISARLGICLFLGVIMALLYIRTSNLFLIVGIHALIDTNTSLLNGIEDPVEHAIYTVLMILLLIIWPVFRIRNPWISESKVSEISM